MSGVTSARWLMPCQRGASGSSWVMASIVGPERAGTVGPRRANDIASDRWTAVPRRRASCPTSAPSKACETRSRGTTSGSKGAVMDIYAFRADVFVTPPPDVTGFDVEASDGHIGKVDEATMAPGATCLVVDTGFWIFGKKRMIPAGVIRAVDVDEKKVVVSMT